jgi:cobalt/nickel transport system permease protein
MGGSHLQGTEGPQLHVPGHSPVHRLPAASKLVGLVTFAVAVALTPRRAIGAFVIDAALVIMVVLVARLHWRLVLARLAVITPFVLVAALIPFLAEGGDRIDLAGWSLSIDGLWAAWNIVAKASLGATASIIVSASTPIPDLIAGLGRLRLPWVLVAIISFMFRYLDLIADELRRMRRAMVARCHDPRWLWQVRPIAGSAGALFVRSYERGERVHQAMIARGYTGAMPALREQPTARWHQIAAVLPGTVAGVALAVAVIAP